MVKTDSLLLLAGPVEGGGLYCKSDSANNCVCVGGWEMFGTSNWDKGSGYPSICLAVTDVQFPPVRKHSALAQHESQTQIWITGYYCFSQDLLQQNIFWVRL